MPKGKKKNHQQVDKIEKEKKTIERDRERERLRLVCDCVCVWGGNNVKCGVREQKEIDGIMERQFKKKKKKKKKQWQTMEIKTVKIKREKSKIYQWGKNEGEKE